jgi:divalent metal cation (Fe/Co/Zn/Cd) transporter
MNFKVFHSRHFVKVNVVFVYKDGTESEKLKQIFAVERFTKISAKKEGEKIVYSTVISTDKIISATEIHKILEENSSIISIARQDDDF